MSKNKIVEKNKPNEIEEDFNFADYFQDDDYSDEEFMPIFSDMLAASNHQMTIALELTKLAIGKNASSMNEDAIFSIFNKASNIIAEQSPLKTFWEKINLN